MKYFNYLISFGLMSLLTVAAHGQTIFKYKGKEYKQSDLSTALKQDWHDIESEAHHRKLQLIDEAMIDAHFAELAKKKKSTLEKEKEAFFTTKEPKEDEIKKFYEKHKAKIPPSYKYDMIKPQLVSLMQKEASQEVREKLLKKIKSEKGTEAMLAAPEAPAVQVDIAGYPMKGNKNAKIEIIEFADYQCPHCAHAYETIKKMWPEVKDKVKLVYIDFPINPSGISKTVAQGAYCAMQQDKYWEYHNKAFENQKDLSNDTPTKFAKDLKLDEKKFASCLKDKKSMEFVEKGKQEGNRIGVKGTPTILINGKRLTHSHGEDDSLESSIRAAIDGALKS